MGRRSSGGDSISLFPFMSILVCLIGSLTLMITLLMATQAESDQSQEVIERHHKYSEMKAEIAAQESEIDALEQLIKDAALLRDQARKALEEAAELEKQQKERMDRVDVNSEYAKMLAEANDLRKRITEIEGDPAELQTLIDELQKEVDRRKAGPEEAVVQIRPGGSGVDIDPTFVEVTATGLVVHEGAEPLRIRAGDLGKEGGDYYLLLQRVASSPKGEIIFLMRPDAISTYNTARHFARTFYFPSGYARNGKLPVPSQGNIDLSVFRKE